MIEPEIFRVVPVDPARHSIGTGWLNLLQMAFWKSFTAKFWKPASIFKALNVMVGTLSSGGSNLFVSSPIFCKSFEPSVEFAHCSMMPIVASFT
jgi:hypothetical protein